MSILDNLYHYKFEVTRVIDGDTIVGIRDNGNKNYDTDVIVRLNDIQAPEISKAKTLTEKGEGRKAKAFLEELVLGKTVVIKTKKDKDDDNFARVLADVYLATGTDVHVNTLMLMNNHAVPYEK